MSQLREERSIEASTSGGWKRLLILASKTLEFASFNLICQAINGLSGILIVQSLSKESYASVAIFNQLLTSANLLSDVGVGMGVKSIGGRLWLKQSQFWTLFRTAESLRTQFFFYATPIVLGVGGFAFYRIGAQTSSMMGYLILMLLGVFPILRVSLLQVPLQFAGLFRPIQKTELSVSLVRLVVVAIVCKIMPLGMLIAVATSAANWLQRYLYQQLVAKDRGMGEYLVQRSIDESMKQELRVLSRATMANTLFFCFQGQITYLLVANYAGTSGVAEFTALGRLGVLLTCFANAFSSVISSRFALCQDEKRLPKFYWWSVFSIAIVMLPIIGFGLAFPNILLLILGKKYMQLDGECRLAIFASCIAVMCQLIWTLNISRAWVRFSNYFYVPSIVLGQAIAIYFCDMSSVMGALMFSIITALAPMWTCVADAYVGISSFKNTPIKE